MELEDVKEKLYELLTPDDIVLAERARALRDVLEAMEFLDVLRYHEVHHYPCCHSAYVYLREALPGVVERVLAEAGLDVDQVRRASGWPAP